MQLAEVSVRPVFNGTILSSLIGAVYQVTRERIRQIECKALRKMKQPTRQSALKNYEEVMDQSGPGALRASAGRGSTGM